MACPSGRQRAGQSGGERSLGNQFDAQFAWHAASCNGGVINEPPTMNRNKNLIFLTIAALLLALATGQSLFLPAMKLLFPDWHTKLSGISDAERASAAWNFCFGFTLFSLMVPFSALVTERFAARAGYAQSLMKSLFVAALAIGASLFYQLQSWESLKRLGAQLDQPIGAQSAQLSEDPLAKIVWFAAVCLVIFGPLDLWIAHKQKQWRKEPGGVPLQQAT